MSHQVLARTWRPKSFADLVGQEHVVRALANALERGRLHHAYLFTGTRGVGKTTLARILARCLNCETGITATPCGRCAACEQIDAGRFVDLIEIDAASYTGVDNMREVLENAQYAPTAGRFKVYIIDEVHMLSKNAFNAMLKTLEEPPEHVVFILATTDPQKVPVTVLSRCLQFNLKQMTPDLVVHHLRHVLEAEQVQFEAEALQTIARAAAGSMRDALSLTDQAIAYGQGTLRGDEARAMLGVIDSTRLLPLLEALAEDDGLRLMAMADAIVAQGLSLDAALQDMAQWLHQLALIQVVPEAVDETLPEHVRLRGLASRLAPERVQLYYQITGLGRRDLDWAPDAETGFRMTLLRMLAFRPDDRPLLHPEKSRSSAEADSSGVPGIPPSSRGRKTVTAATAGVFDGDWFALSQTLAGGIKQLASQCELVAFDPESITLRLPEAARSLLNGLGPKLTQAVHEKLGQDIRIHFEAGATGAATPAAQIAKARDMRQAEAEAAIGADPVVQTLIRDFGATVHDISPLDKA